MKLAEFALFEKPMNAKAFADVESRLGNTALVGFELEMVIPYDSAYYRSEDAPLSNSVEIRHFSELSDFAEYFDIWRYDENRIEREYQSWVDIKRDVYVEDKFDRWMEEPSDEELEADEDARDRAIQAAKDKAAKMFDSDDNDHSWSDWLNDQFSHNYDFTQSFSLVPKYGWDSEDGMYASVFTEEPAEDDDEASFMSTAEQVAYSISELVNADVKISRNYHGDSKNGKSWYIEPDSSIDGNGAGLELVSPPMSLKSALSHLGSLCEWMETRAQAETNTTTGLHINVSIPNIAEKLDPLKLVLFLGEAHVAQEFGRQNNTYAKQHLPELIRTIEVKGIVPTDFKSMTDLARTFLTLYQKTKYRTVNLETLSSGYLEFRIAGGVNHTDFGLLKKTVLRFVSAVESACDPEADKKEYARKVANLFSSSVKTVEVPSSPSKDAKDALARLIKMDSRMNRFIDLLHDTSKSEAFHVGNMMTILVDAITHVMRANTKLTPKETTFLKVLLKRHPIPAKRMVDFYEAEETPPEVQAEIKKIFNV